MNGRYLSLSKRLNAVEKAGGGFDPKNVLRGTKRRGEYSILFKRSTIGLRERFFK